MHWTAVSVPRNYSGTVTQQFGLEGPSGVTSSKPHSKQGLFRRDPAAQGRGGRVQGCRSHSLWTKGARSEQSPALFWPPQLCIAPAPQRSPAGRASMEPQWGTDYTQLSTDAKSGISAVRFPYFLVCPKTGRCFRAWRLNPSRKWCHPAGWAAQSAAALLKEELPTLCQVALDCGSHSAGYPWDWWREELLHRLVMKLKCFH